MAGVITIMIAVIIAMWKFYENRALFKQLSKKEWFQLGLGFLFAWIVAVMIVIAGASISKNIEATWLSKLVKVLFVFIGVGFGGVLMTKCLPQKN